MHLIQQTEFDDDRFVNRNRGYGTLETQDGQKGLFLKGRGLQGAVGTVNGDIVDEDGVGSPNVIKEVLVDALGAMRISGMMMPDDVMADFLTNPVKVVGDWDVFYGKMDALIAHELGHAVNMMHHGDERFVSSFMEAADTDTSVDWDTAHIEKIWNGSGCTALEGGKWSGDVRCVMRYDPPINYFGWDKDFYEYPESEGENSKTTYCSSIKGTGINAGSQRRVPNDPAGKPYPVSGDATWGNCKGMMDLKGEHYFGDIEWLQPRYAGDEGLKEEYRERYKDE